MKETISLRTPKHTAAILGLMFSEFGESRMRISKKTLKFIGQRKNLRDAFFNDVWETLTRMNIELIETNRGYCLVKRTALDGAKSYSFKSFKKTTEINFDNFDEIWQEINEIYEVESVDYD